MNNRAKRAIMIIVALMLALEEAGLLYFAYHNNIPWAVVCAAGKITWLLVYYKAFDVIKPWEDEDE